MLARQEDPAAAPTVLYLHGQGGNIGYYWKWVMALWDAGHNVLIVDYRGKGASSGKLCSVDGFQHALCDLPAGSWDVLLFGNDTGNGTFEHLGTFEVNSR